MPRKVRMISKIGIYHIRGILENQGIVDKDFCFD